MCLYAEADWLESLSHQLPIGPEGRSNSTPWRGYHQARGFASASACPGTAGFIGDRYRRNSATVST